MSDPRTDNKTKDEIAAEVGMDGQPGSRRHTQLEAILMALCFGDLERVCERLRQSQDDSGRTAADLSRRLFWLNFVIASATVVVALATAAQAYRLFHGP